MTDQAPRYAQLAESLKRAIAEGRPGIGEQLPTEHALMASHKVSRHTVREALRLLSEAGLIARRRGAGTVVVARETPAAFTQRLGGMEDLLQYARAARLRVLATSRVDGDPALVRRFGLEPDTAYLQITGLREGEEGPPVARTVILVRADLAPGAIALSELRGAITDWIERQHGIAPARIEQAIEAHLLTPEEAEPLQAAVAGAALMTRRRYLDAQGRIIAVSESVHPGDRFSYDMVLTREG
ncbi:GntR family transcriptional regulator [Marinicauda algicola]|uniref:GntR family transcriptional regulator n=1 Tax=Marinicauda algicola TaxID=2029849 RepID=UPI001F136F61|nr:GntR family transcriptional regulator [Marinicauda algicola]